MNSALRTIRIPRPIYENIMVILESLNRNYDGTKMESLEFISVGRLKELLDILLLRSKRKTEFGVDIPLNGAEAADILRACWETKNFYNDIGGEGTLGLSFNEFRTAINEIASVLGRIAQF